MAGSIVVLVCVVGGFLMAGGNLLLLWHPSEIIVIVGSAFGAFITSNPLKVVKAAFTNALALFKKPHYDRDSYVDLLNLVFDLLVRARKEGMLAIEADVENPSASPIFGKYPAVVADHHMMEFITDCLRLMVGGNLDPNELESLLEYELDTHHKEAAEPAHAVQKVADALPGFGIVAAVLGIVNTMSTIEGASSAAIGHKVGAALVGTFLGILIAYGFVGPIAAAMEARPRGRQGVRGGEDGLGGERARLLAASCRRIRAQAPLQRRATELHGTRRTFEEQAESVSDRP